MQLTHALRSLQRAKGLTFISILTVALGVGAGTALFSVVKAVLLNPLPYPQPDRLTWVEAIMGGGPARVSMPDFDDWRSQNRGFAALAAYSDSPILVGGGETPELTSGVIVTEDFFDVLEVSRRWAASSRPTSIVPASRSRPRWSATACGSAHLAAIRTSSAARSRWWVFVRR